MELTLIPNEEKKKILSLLDFSNLDKWVTYFHKPGTYTTQSSLVTSATKKNYATKNKMPGEMRKTRVGVIRKEIPHGEEGEEEKDGGEGRWRTT